MSHPYISFDSAAKVNGDTLLAIPAAFSVSATAEVLLRLHGLPAQPKAGQWYPLQAWLNLLAQIEESFGSATVYAVGLHIITHSQWPANLRSLEEAVHALDLACRSNIKGEPIGYYRAEPCGQRCLQVECLTPTPPDFERGILTGMARQFKPAESLRVSVDPAPLAGDDNPLLKRFIIRW